MPLLMAEAGYTQPATRKDILVLGKQALGNVLVGTDSMQASRLYLRTRSENCKQISLCNGWWRFIRTN